MTKVDLSGQISSRRSANAKGLAAFGVTAALGKTSSLYRTIREGGPVTIFTVGYERRTGEDMIAALRDAGVEYLADIRDKPVSRKPDFRAAALQAFCEDARIEYGGWSKLGSTEHQRERLHETGDLARFHKAFRGHAIKELDADIERLARVAKRKIVALMCYERAHDECHRSVVADLVAEKLGAGITAIL